VESRVHLLGVPRRGPPAVAALRPGTPDGGAGDGGAPLPPGLAAYLAAFLAIRADWVTRDELVALLWPDAEPRRARHNLSQLLYAVRRSDWGHDVEGEAVRVRWLVDTDVAAFRRAASEGDWRGTVDAYGGELLEGVAPPGSPACDAWLRGEREDLRETWREAATAYAAELARDGRWSESARRLRRLLASDELLEDAVQSLIRCEAMAGRRDAALQAYERFRERLHDELGLEPLDATTRLAAAVRSGDLGPDAPDSTPSLRTVPPHGGRPARRPADRQGRDVRPGPVRNLAPDGTPFVGRALELAELHALLERGEHRLITVRAPGGAGKSRLARQLARERAGHHEDGAAWVALSAATDEEATIDAIAGALGLQIDPEPAALIRGLAGRDLLLTLDGAEHLPDLPGLAIGLLDGCPQLRTVVTSRAALDVPGEAVVPLDGLSVPPRDDAEDAEAYDAFGLALRAAHRVRPDFHPRGEERTALVSLTRILAGMPLAIELAASWLRVLEPSELLYEVRRDLDVIRDRFDELDPRHASLRAVFESSWSLLADAEREALRRLGVFRGGCTRDTAAAVAEVPLGTLLTLVNRSLLQRDGDRRFVVHPVVQRFAEEKLAEREELASQLAARHRAYFLAVADDADRRLDGPEQQTALAGLASEHANLLHALDHAITLGEGEDAHALAAALGRYWRWSGHLREALDRFERLRALPGPTAPTSTRIRSLLAEGLLLEKAGRYAPADRAFEAALSGAQALGDAGLAAAARCDQATVAWRRGDLETARAKLDEACATYRELGRDAALAGTLGNLGNVLRDAGDLTAAHAHYDDALALAERIDHVWEIANVRNNKAIAFAYGDDLEAARGEFEHALALQRSIDNRPGVSRSLTNLGNVHLDTGDLESAEALYREALALSEELGDLDGTAHLFVNLGVLAQWTGAYDQAHDLYGRSLRVRRDLGARGLAAQSVSCFLDLAVARGAHERALVLAGAVRALNRAIGVPLTARQQHVYDDALAAARGAVPAHRAGELERRGEGLTEREAIAFALAERAVA